jgi:hypothetical protein
MGSNYISDGERQYLEQRKAEQEATERWATAKNTELVGDPKTYKGIRYQMQQRGSFVCLNVPVNSVLQGSFTTALTLHRIIDSLEANKALPKVTN